jgi:hypothetical protein
MNFVKVFLVILLSILLIVFFWLVYFDSDRLVVKNVKISSSIGFFPDGIDKKIKDSVGGNILLIDRLYLKEKLKGLSSDVESVDVVVYPPDTLSVDVIYRIPVVRVVYKSGVNKFFDGEFREVNEYVPGMFSNLVVVFVESWDEKTLREISKIVSRIDSSILSSRFFPKAFVVKEEGVYAMNKYYDITVFFGNEVNEDKVKKSFLVIKYIIQRNLPVRFVDARFDNMIGR